MLPDFQLEKKGYIAKEPDGGVYFFDDEPHKIVNGDGKSEWFPIGYGDSCLITEEAAVSCFLDESTVYPVKMVIYPDYPKQ